MRSVAQPFVAFALAATLAACAAPVRQSPAPVTSMSTAVTARLVYENRPTAERTLAGRVIDDATGLPIKVAGAIRLDDRAAVVTTDAVGHVDVTDVEPGLHTMVTTAQGFVPRTDTVVVRDHGGVALEMRLLRAPVEAGMLVRAAPATAYVVPLSINASRRVATDVASAP